MSSYLLNDAKDLFLGVVFMLVLICIAYQFDIMARIIKIIYILFWFCITPGTFIYVAFFIHVDFMPAVCTLLLGFVLAIPWFRIGLPALLEEINL